MNLRWIGFVFFCLLVGCIENPTSGGKDTNLSGAVGGLGQLNPAEGAFLYDPTSTPNTDPTPTFLVTGLKNRDMVYLYHDSACGQLAASGDSTGDSLTITVPALNPGIHSFSIKRRWEDDNIESPCSQNIISYELWNNNVILTGLADDSVPTTSKSWSWGCSGEETTCEYRYAVTNSPTHVFNNSPYQLTDSAQQVSGTGTYYLHVQGRDALHSFLETPVETYSAVLDNTPPGVSSIQAPSNGTYNLSDNLDFRVTFSEAVIVSGTPRLSLQVGSSTRYANYHSSNGGGTELTFRYSPQSGDSDLGGIGFISTQIDLNGGNIQDTAGNQTALDFSGVAPSLININVDAASPQVAGLTNDPTLTKSKTWTWSCNRPNCSYRYTVDSISITAPGGTYGTTTSETVNSGNGTRYLHIQVRDNDNGQESAVQHFSAILDNTIPTINSVLPPANSTYSEAQAVDFVLNYSDVVHIVGYPYISLTVSTDSRSAQYASGTGSSAITFRYLPQAGDSDLDGITVSGDAIQLNAGTIKDAAGNDASGDFTGLIPSLTGILVDGLPPNITAMTKPDDDTYDSSENIEFTLTFSETVSVSGTPRLNLEVGTQTRYANYYSNSGNQITFRYTPQTGDRDDNGIQFQSPSIQFNGGQITDPAGNLANPNFSSFIPALSGVRVDSQPAEVIAVTPPPTAIYNVTQGLNFTLNFNRDITVTGTPQLALWVGNQLRYAQHQATLSSRNMIFNYSLQSGDSDDNGVSLPSPSIDLNGGSINDTGSSPANLDFSSFAPDLSGVIVDAVLPMLVNVTHDAIPKQNKTWNWNCSKSNCTYRFVVDTNPSTVPTGIYSGTTSTTQSSGDGTYYLHIQARDSLGNESPIMHLSAILDNTAPTFSGTLDISGGGTASSTAFVDWTNATLTDAHISVAKLQIAVGRDTTEDGIDPEDIGNIVGWRNIPNGVNLNPPRYRIEDGIDGFSLSLEEETDYFISLRVRDPVGHFSNILHTDAWGIFTPRQVQGLELWLDGQDLASLFQDETCSTSITTNGNPVGCWRDKSGEDHHATQSTSSRRPTYQTGGHIRFSNQSHLLETDNLLSGSYDELSVFMVFNQMGDSSWPVGFSLNGGHSGHCSTANVTTRVSSHMFQNGELYWFFGGCGNANAHRLITTSANSANGNRHFYHMGSSATDDLLFVRKDGKILSSKSFPVNINAPSTSYVVIGNGERNDSNGAVNGQISEFLVYTSHISAADRQKLEGYLACKWGLQSELPSDHPYLATCP